MGHSSLEAELLAFLRPDESAAELLARTYVEPLFTGVPLIDQHITFRPGNVLEVAGAAGSGKTEVLLQVAVTCILPATLHGIHFGGRQENVLVFDLDCKFDGLRLLQLVHERVGQSLQAFRQAPAQGEFEAVVEDCLQRLHLVRCHSSFDFLATLAVSRPLLTHLAAHGGIRCVLVDNVAAYYYIDRVGRGPVAAAAGVGVYHDITREGAPLTLHRVQTAVARELRELAQEHRVALIVTKNLLMPGGREADAWSYREFMLKPWQELVTHRLMLKPPASFDGADGGGQPHPHLARWQEPPEAAVMRFGVSQLGLVLA